MAGIKITAADKEFSLCVRESSDWHCQRCQRQYDYPGNTRGLHCSHFYGRGNWSVRFCPDNAFAHCHGCHQYLSANPALFDQWVRGELGETRYEILREKWQDLDRGRRAKRSIKEIAKHYRDEFARMREARTEVGHWDLTFEEWD